MQVLWKRKQFLLYIRRVAQAVTNREYIAFDNITFEEKRTELLDRQVEYILGHYDTDISLRSTKSWWWCVRKTVEWMVQIIHKEPFMQ